MQNPVAVKLKIGLDFYLYKSECFPHAIYLVGLVVRAVTGGASNGYAKKTSFPASI
jgi:hypothetical protein